MYGEEDKKFVFNSVIVGQIARAQYKITNPNKVLNYFNDDGHFIT